jgi:hypothetical protein
VLHVESSAGETQDTTEYLTFTPFSVWGFYFALLTFLTNKNSLGSDLANREKP